LRGIRGAITVTENTEEAILSATARLVQRMMNENNAHVSEIAAALFSVTPDLNAAFPARAVREMGWDTVPLLDFVSPDVPGALQRCIRVLLLWNSRTPQTSVRHVYMEGAGVLRPDLANRGEN